MRRLPIAFGALMIAVLLAVLSLGAARHASAQAAVPDFTKFGFPRVVGSVDFIPGTAQTISAGTQQVVLPADFISKTVKFELLEGDASFFTSSIPITDQGRTVIIAWAFRVTDTATGNLVGRFDKPVQWSVTDPRIAAGSEVYNTTAANPPVVVENTTPATISGTTLSHPFGGAGVGWLVLGPEAAAAPTPAPAPTEVPVIAPPPVTPPGMPTTGSADFGSMAALLALLAAGITASGLLLRRRRA